MTALLLPATAAVPAQLTTFVGRERELAAVLGLLPIARLVTLTGAGGSGKTRIAAEVARSLAEHLSDGVAWIEIQGSALDDVLALAWSSTPGLPITFSI